MDNVLVPIRTMSITPVGLELSGVPSWDEWQAMGYQLQRCSRVMPWLLGDWLNIGEREFGETYTQALELTDRSVSTLQNYKYVASRVDCSRRREQLSWTHHEIVASLSPSDQDYWLERALENGWPTHEMRAEVRAALGQPPLSRVVLSLADATILCEAIERCDGQVDVSEALGVVQRIRERMGDDPQLP